jgi:uncharacterized protein (DUF1800 family)
MSPLCFAQQQTTWSRWTFLLLNSFVAIALSLVGAGAVFPTAHAQAAPVPPTAPPISTRGSIDVDGDGKSVLLVRTPLATANGAPQTQVGRLVGNQFQFTRVPDPGASFRIAGITDYDGNGKSDLVVQNISQGETGDVYLWSNFSSETSRVLRQAKLAWDVQVVGDLDGDGKGDLVWRYVVPNSPDSGVTYVWFSNGTDSPIVRKRGGAPLSWKLIGAADLNSDQAADMVFVSPDNQIRVLMATANRTCANLTAGIVPQGFSPLALHDFSGNKRGDLLVRNNTNGQVALLSLNASGMTLPAYSGDPDDRDASCTPSSQVITAQTINLPISDPSWQYYAAGDYDGNGVFDIVWLKRDGTLALWLMGGINAQSIYEIRAILQNVGGTTVGFAATSGTSVWSPVGGSNANNRPPSVSINSPVTGTTLPLNLAVNLSATATDTDGFVAKVEYLANGIVIGESTQAPYGIPWNPSTAGSYTLIARASDDMGRTAISSPVSVTVAVGSLSSAITVGITSPLSPASVVVNSPISISANATTTSGTLARVEFFVDANKIGEDTSPPYSLVWTPTTLGTYSLTVRATDNLGGTALSQPVALEVLPPLTNSSPTEESAARFLLQAQFSASDDQILAVRAKGFSSWLQSAYAAPRGVAGWDWLTSRGYATIDTNTRYYDNYYPGDLMIWNQLMTSPDPVRQRLSLALSEYFVVSLTGLDLGWRSHAIAHYWDTLNKNAFGNFRQLLEDVTLNPAMGFYLNTRGNQKENAATGRQPDENYAREVMQLFTIGLYELNQDGTPKLDAAGDPIESYTADDVTNLARVFTGYDFDRTGNVNTFDPAQNRTIGNHLFTRLPMIFNSNQHSVLEKRFLGVSIPANTPGPAALKTALDTLFNNANVGPFFARQMIQRLVTSDPSPAYVGRVSAAFNDNGAGVRGDLKAVWSAILLDPEARAAGSLTDANFGKVREPMIRFVQWGRTFGATSAAGTWKIFDLSNPATQLGQSPLRSPSVFNYFRPGYIPPGTVMAARKATSPEFQILNESSVGGYLNYMQGVIRNGVFVNAPDLPNTASNARNGFDIKATYSKELPLAADPAALVARLNLLLAAGQLSTTTVSTIREAVASMPFTGAGTETQKLDRVAAAVLLVMGSPEFLIQK